MLRIIGTNQRFKLADCLWKRLAKEKDVISYIENEFYVHPT